MCLDRLNRRSGNIVQFELSQRLCFLIAPMSLHRLSVNSSPILERILVLVSLGEPHSVGRMVVLSCNHKIAVLVASVSSYFAIGDGFNVEMGEDHLVLHLILAVVPIPALLRDDELELEVPLRAIRLERPISFQTSIGPLSLKS